MLKRMVVMAALALGIAATALVVPITAGAQSPVTFGDGHCLAPGLGDNAAPAQGAGGGVQMSQITRWVAWSFVSTRWMFAGNPVFSQFSNFNLGARTPRVW